MFAPSQAQYAPTPLVIQILGQVTFGIFAIVATVLAFEAFWVAGMVVAITLAVCGFGRRSERHLAYRFKSGGRHQSDGIEVSTCEPAQPVQPTPTGNASFDAYRADVLKRLEEEQKSFVDFLARLREARDKSELDTFMADRARIAPPTATDAPHSGLY